MLKLKRKRHLVPLELEDYPVYVYLEPLETRLPLDFLLIGIIMDFIYGDYRHVSTI